MTVPPPCILCDAERLGLALRARRLERFEADLWWLYVRAQFMLAFALVLFVASVLVQCLK